MDEIVTSPELKAPERRQSRAEGLQIERARSNPLLAALSILFRVHTISERTLARNRE